MPNQPYDKLPTNVRRQTPPPLPATVTDDQPTFDEFARKKITAGLFGIFLGSWGIHKFIIGRKTAGIIMMSFTIAGIAGACLIVPLLFPITMHFIGIIEGVIYLSRTEKSFYKLYAVDKRSWF